MICTITRQTMARPVACRHVPRCPSATAPDWAAAHTMIAHPEQGWSLLCNGVVLFDDTGGLLPGGGVAAPRACSQFQGRHLSREDVPRVCPA